MLLSGLALLSATPVLLFEFWAVFLLGLSSLEEDSFCLYTILSSVSSAMSSMRSATSSMECLKLVVVVVVPRLTILS